jgi:hypothetical protein
MYDIDLSLGPFAGVVFINPDAGSCQPENPGFGFTGRIFLQPASDSVSVVPLFLP